MDENDFYDRLGIKRTATRVEIRRAYRKLARRYHPDFNPGDRAAEIRYQRVHQAFQILSDVEERERYDRRGFHPPSTHVPSYGFDGFDFTTATAAEADILPEIFASSTPERAAAGEDTLHHLTMSFDESLRGLETSFQVRRLVACRGCAGWGELASGVPATCESCRGTGRLTQSRGHMVFAKPCPECGGAGAVDRYPCPDCRGAGRVAAEETVRVRIPGGVVDGSKLRVPGKGNDGRGGAPTGDLYVQILVTPHAFFTREGDDLLCTIPITFPEAALGCKLEIPSVEGPVRFRVPAGTQCGHTIRLPGRGAPSRRARAGRGDLLVTLRVVTPQVYDQRAQALLRELARLHPENPREERWRGVRGVAPSASGESS